MSSLAPLTIVLLIIAVTASFTEGSVAWGVLPFILAIANEVARIVVIARGGTPDGDDLS
jgi:hypothetical protein